MVVPQTSFLIERGNKMVTVGQFETIVVLRSVHLTDMLELQEVALLNPGVYPDADGNLPAGKYAVYYRVWMEAREGGGILADYTGTGLAPSEPVIKFFLDNK